MFSLSLARLFSFFGLTFTIDSTFDSTVDSFVVFTTFFCGRPRFLGSPSFVTLSPSGLVLALGSIFLGLPLFWGLSFSILVALSTSESMHFFSTFLSFVTDDRTEDISEISDNSLSNMAVASSGLTSSLACEFTFFLSIRSSLFSPEIREKARGD